jgi:hypothetical protein
MFIAILADGGELKCLPAGVTGMQTAAEGSVRVKGTTWKSGTSREDGAEGEGSGQGGETE